MTETNEDYALLIAHREDYNPTYEEQCRNDPEQWAELYTRNLLILANYYKKLGQIGKAIFNEEKALASCHKYQQPTEQWHRCHADILNNLAYSYAQSDRFGEAISFGQEALSIREDYFEQTPEGWAEDFTTSLNNLASCYEELAELDTAISLQVRALAVIKKQYLLDSSLWHETYITTLNNLACTYEVTERYHDSLKLIMDILHIYKKLHDQEPLTWLPEYVGAIQDVATLNIRLQDYTEAEVYFKLYMDLHSSMVIDDIDFYLDYIYCFVHYVKASTHLPSGSFIKFNEMADEFKTRMKAVFVDEYQVKIEQILSDYLELLDVNNPLDNKNRQIATQYFS